MRIKQLLCTIAAICLILPSAVFAADVTVTQNGNNIIIRGQLDLEYGEEQISVILVERNAPSGAFAADQVGHIDIMRSSGNFEFNFNMGGATRRYTVFISGESTLNVIERNFVYASSGDLLSAINIVNNAGTAALMRAALRESINGIAVYEILGVSLEDEELVQESADIYRFLAEQRPFAAERSSDVANAFNIGIIVRRIRESTSATNVMSLLTANSDILNLYETGGVIDRIGSLYVRNMTNIGERIRTSVFANIDELRTVYEQAVILEAIQNPRSGSRFDVEAALREARFIIGIQTAWNTFSGLSDANRVTVMTQIMGRTFTDLDELRRAFERAVTDVSGVRPPVVTPPGSSGPGGGFGGGTFVAGSDVSAEFLESLSDNQYDGGEAPIFNDIAGVPWAFEAIAALTDRGIISGRGGGVFAPNDAITREEFVKIIVLAFEVPLGGAEVLFADASETGWYNTYVNAAFEAGVVQGVGDNIFGVGRNITREDLVVMACRAVGGQYLFEPYEGAAFADEYDMSDYARESVMSFFAAGIVTGYENNIFLPQNTATRAEAVQIVYRLLAFLNIV